MAHGETDRPTGQSSWKQIDTSTAPGVLAKTPKPADERRKVYMTNGAKTQRKNNPDSTQNQNLCS